MRKFGLAALIVAGFLGWIAPTGQAGVTPAMSSASIVPMQIMGASPNLPTEHFVDYSLVFP